MKDKTKFHNLKNDYDNYQKTILNNGITIITNKVSQYTSFALGVFINAGSRDDSPNTSGTAHFVEHLIFRKSKKYNSKQIANKFEEFGAYTNAYTTQEITCFYVRALKPHIKKSINLLLEIVLNPDFNETDTNIERKIILEEIKSYEDDIEENISDIGDKLLFGNHSLGNPILGSINSIKSITIQNLNDFHKKFYNPSNIIISIVGDIEHHKLCEYIETQLNTFELNKKYKNERIIPTIGPVQKQIVIKHIQQSHILLLHQIPDINSPERYSIGIMNTILGDGMSSRLYQNIRDKFGFAYSIYSSVQLYSDIGVLSIYAAMDYEKLQIIKDLIIKEVNKLKNISQKELNRAKEQYITGITLDNESLSSIMQNLAKTEFTNGKYEPIQSIYQNILTIESADIINSAKKYIIEKDFFELSMIPKNNKHK